MDFLPFDGSPESGEILHHASEDEALQLVFVSSEIVSEPPLSEKTRLSEVFKVKNGSSF